MNARFKLCFIIVAILIFAGQGHAQINPQTLIAAWRFDEGEGKIARDVEGKSITGILRGPIEWVDGMFDSALEFNGINTYVSIPDSPHINMGGPFTDRTISAMFRCDDVTVASRKQVVYEEGGWLRGFNIYVYDDKLYVGGWNRREYNWDGSWLSTSVESNNWYHVALVLRNGANAVEPDKFEMWVDGRLIGTDSGGQLFEHPEDTAIGAVDFNTVFQDEVVEQMNGHYFAGVIDEVRLFSVALAPADILNLAGPLAVEPTRKLGSTWAAVKAQR